MNKKNRTTAALLALFGGAFGVHKFYLNRPGQGVFFIIAFMVFYRMSIILGVIDAVRLFMMSDEDFDREYNSGTKEWESFRNKRANRSARRSRSTTERTTRGRARSSRRSTRDSDLRVERSGRSRYEQERGRPSRSRARKAPPRRERPKDNPFKQSGIRRFKEYDISGAIEDFQKALKIDSKDAAIHFNIAASYSINEEKEKAYHHLSQAVSYGMNDVDKIQSHEAFAYLRIQDDWQAFVDNGFKTTQAPKSIAPESADSLLEDDVLLAQLNKLKELRDKGLLTDAEYSLQKERLRS